ncbi:MAG: hypothetical protein QNM02_08540 [Acidimicrobiia bacterium]|nr:hypothetical protein [Acidimicrobiia bacterium]
MEIGGMTYPDVSDAVAAQASIAIVLAAFAFAGFVLLLNNMASADSGGRRPVRVRYHSLEGRALFLLVATFTIGILAGFLYSTSLGVEGASVYRGYVVAQVAFGVEVFAMITAILILLERYLRKPGPLYAWLISLGVITWSLFRLTVDLYQAWDRDVSTSSATWVVAFALLAPALLLVYLVAASGATRFRPESTTTLRLTLTDRRIRNFFADSSMGYAAMVAVIGVVTGILHVAVTLGNRSAFRPWQLLVLSIALGVASVWTILHARPARDDAKWETERRQDGSYEVLIPELPELSSLLNRCAAVGESGDERADAIRVLCMEMETANSEIERSRSPIVRSRGIIAGSAVLQLTSDGYVELESSDDAVSGSELCDVHQLIRELGRWEALERAPSR